MKLYILPYQYYELFMRDNLNIFRREYNLYQFEENFFLFYNSYGSLLKYKTMFNSFSSNINEYDMKDISYPDINQSYLDAYKFIYRNKNKFETFVITPTNTFIKDEISYFLFKIGFKDYKHVYENEFENKDYLFFENYVYNKFETKIEKNILYNIFITYLSHIITMFFIKSTVPISMNLSKLLIYINLKNNPVSKNIKKIKLIDGTSLLAFKILNNTLIKNDQNVFTLYNWEDKYIQQRYFFEGTLININGEVYTVEEKINSNEILKISKSNKILSEMLNILEQIIPQPTILKTIDDLDVIELDENETIFNIPNWNIKYNNFENDLTVIKNFIGPMNKEELGEFIQNNITALIESLTSKYNNTGLPLGICPSCSRGYIWKGNKLYYCDSCSDFSLWNVTNEKNLGFVPNKYQIKFLLNNNLIFSIKKIKYKLIQYQNKEKVNIWKILKLSNQNR